MKKLKSIIIRIYNLYYKIRFFRGGRVPAAGCINAPYYIEFSKNICFKGNYCHIGPGAYFCAQGGIQLGNNVIIGPRCSIWSYSHDYLSVVSIPYGGEDKLQKVVVGDNVWIGFGVTILPGTNISEGCIVGAGAVLKGYYPPCSVIVGNPAKVIKTLPLERYNLMKENGLLYLKLKSERNV